MAKEKEDRELPEAATKSTDEQEYISLFYSDIMPLCVCHIFLSIIQRLSYLVIYVWGCGFVDALVSWYCDMMCCRLIISQVWAMMLLCGWDQ